MKKSCNKVTAVIPALLLVACVDNRNDFTGASTNSDETTASLPAPENLSATASDNEVNLSWDAVDGASAYNVYIYNQSGYIQSNYSPTNFNAANTSASAIVSTNSHLLSSLEYEVDYYFNVTALADDLESSQSNEVGVRPLQNVSNSTPYVQLLDDSANAAEVVTLSAEVSDPDGNNISYLWQQTSGASVDIIDGNESEASFTAPTVDAPVELGFALTVFDNLGASSTSSATVTVSDNLSPQVDAGADQSVSPGATVDLLGSASDSDGSVVDIAWQQESGSIVSLSSNSTLDTSFTAPSANSSELTLVFRLSVTDDRGASVTDTVSVIVAADQATTTVYRVDVAENSNGTIHVATTNDPEQESLTFSLSGTDANDFSIDSSSGAISFISTPDYEVPIDTNTDNAYELTFEVSNGTTTTLQELVITVIDVDEAPTITSAPDASTPENTTITYTASATDPENTPLSYSLSGTDAANFSIDPSSGAISFTTIPDYENPADADANNVYALTLAVSDSTHTTSQALSITVTNIDEPPTITSAASANILENTTTTIYTVSASDPENGALSYSLSATDAANFSIDPSSGAISFVINPDYENPADADANNIYELTLEVSDSTHTTSQALAITVDDANDNAPIITPSQGFEIAENSIDGSIIGTVVATDADASPTTYQDWTITSGNTNAAFAIDSSSGELSVAASSQLDYDNGATSYTLILTVSDGTNTSSAETVIINVNDLNDNTPVITASQNFDINENSANGTSVGTVVATDADATTTTYQDWTIASGDTNSAFAIDSDTGEITVNTSSELDTETTPSYSLSITVSDGTNTSSAETVTINVNDLNDNTPVIIASQSFNIDENSANATSVGTVVATDADATTTTYQDWTITSGDTNNAFAIDPSSGEITVQTSSELDYDNGATSYTLILTVSDGTNTSSAETVTINVNDINDNTPVITASQSFNIDENSANATSVGTVVATDADATTTTYQDWTITSGDTNNAFAIDPSSGEITVQTSSELDYDNGATSYTLILTVSDGTNTSSAETVIINVNDLNDNTPVITASQNFDINENSANGTSVGTVVATDADATTTTYQDWTITSGDTNNAFAIDPSSGEISVQTSSELDYDNGATSYTLILTVSDGTNTSSAETVTINVNDLNDNTPVIIASQSFNIDENSANATSVGTVVATDADATTTTYQDWTITSGDTNNAFAIDPSSGEITVQTSSELDYDNGATSYTLILTVSDGTNTSSAETVTINVNDLNDNTPVIIASQSFNIDENSANATSVGTVVATDADATTTTYQDWTITSGDTNNAFAIDPSSGEITVQTSSELDYDNGATSYTLILTVSDGTNTSSAETVIINVKDLNDNTPVITASQSFNIDENSANATSVGTVVATDADATTTTYQDWTIASGDTNNAFAIDPSSGEITVQTSSALDYDNGATSYTLILTVSDGTNTSSAETVTINVNDLNDNTPVITASQNFDINENSANGTSVGTVVATDADATTTTYQDWTITSGDTNNAFAIDPSSGEITVQTSSELDYDNGATSYTLILTVSDGTNTSSAETVTINVNDINDNTPVITASQSFNIDENSANATSVGTVAASDADTTTTYQDWKITGGNTDNAFAIDPSSGEITVADANQLDYETEPTSYNLSITVSDGVNTSSAENVTINVNDINDNTPVITASQNFDINENSANGTSVGTVVATDADATTTTYQDWTITSGDTNNAFAIDPSSGEISVQTSSELDYDNGATSYTLILTVSDGTNTSSAETVTINVNDLNDNTPVIIASQSFNIDENSANATSVGTVVATDADATTTTYQDWTITSGDTNNAFAIDPSSGEITVQTSSELDYDNGATSYTLILTVSDGTNTSSAETVTINVNDLNDNTPVITASQSFNIDENSANATSVGTVVATDADATTTTYQDWTITSGDTNNAFAIDPSSGEITVQTSSELDYDNGATSYTLILTVSDGTNTSSAETVIINVKDLNDNTPVITASQSFNIDENSANATSVGTVVATDADATTTTYQDWTIASGDTNNAFAIDPSSGEITVQTSSALDYDNGATSYTLILTVSDGTNTSSAETVTINVNDLNDNTPVITASQNFDINENSANGTSVGTVVVTDADATATTYQDWKITGGNTDNAFAIGSSSGEITVVDASKLDYETEPTSYNLSITVSDGVNTSSTETVTINVNDLNDNTPVITASQSFSIDENGENGASIGTVAATDGDATATAYQDWKITGGNTDNAFGIDSSSGEITVADGSQLDYETDPTSYNLSITVSDGTNTSSAETVTINVNDLNDNTPVITASQIFGIDENSEDGTVVGTVEVSDGDVTATTYQDWKITGGNTDNAFGIDSSSGEITVADGSQLDYETDLTSYNLSITVSDGTNTSSAETVTINVNDLNDNTPVITASQIFGIDENSEDDTVVGTVEVSDDDVTATTYQDWTIASGDTNSAFAIDSDTGEITVNTSSELDTETTPSYSLSITVSDGTNTSSAETVTINVNDLNDNTPVIIASQSFNIDENSANATSVGTVVATDADATTTTYQDWTITSGDTNNAFAIDPSSGEITVQTSSELDYDNGATSYTLILTVSDGTNTSSAETVTINVNDLNDNTPVISASQIFGIDENSEDGTVVGTVEVSDGDVTATTYQDWKITGGNTDNAFGIDSSSGEITVADGSQLDYETDLTSYNLSITVSDGTNTSSAETVTINVNDLNDNTPVITASQIFGIDENSEDDTVVGTVEVSDDDVTATTYQDWKITGGNTDNAFGIDSSSGEITVADASQLDYETYPTSYNLSITVSDGANISSAETVTINVNDINDNTPVITASQSFSIDENSADSSSVGTVVASDVDATATTYQDWKITGGNTDNAFDINSSSGEITVADASQLDYETEPNSYNLSITVSDGTNTSSAETVTINVNDLNDNLPIIAASQSFSIDENSANATSLGTVAATDADATATTYQDWKITGGNTNSAFAIAPDTGELTVNTSSELDTETTPSYSLSITVSDGATTSSAETVTINVNDLNDNTPIITASQIFGIDENSEDDTVVGTVEVSDDDVTATTYQDWKITGGNTDNAFGIDSSSGEITVADASQLDYETYPTSYNLSITVSDGANISSAETVTINVNDINDNTPVITASQSFSIDENSADSSSVGTVVASDVDATATTYQDWKITGGNTDNAFAIGSSSGEITVVDASKLDYETEPNSYNLSITVSDGTNTSSAETVTINVNDLNDNLPIINASQSFSIDENSADDTSVGTVAATDADATATTYQDWKITGGNTSNAFAIDSSSGELTVADTSQLDYEGGAISYTLSLTVSDGTNTSSAETVTINIDDINDNAPIITPSQSFDIDEASANDTPVGTVALTDADSAAVNTFTWSITAGNTNDAFAIDPSSGEITVNTSSELDYEGGTILYTLALTVSDGATTSAAEEITINILDVSEHDAAPSAAYLGLPDNYINITFTPESGVSYQLHRSFVEGCISSSCDAEGYKSFASPNSSGTADTMTFSQTHYYSLVGDNSTTFTTSINDSDGAKLAALIAAQSLTTEYDLANDWVNISATDSNNVTYTLYMAGEPFAAGGCEDSELDNISSLCADGSSLSDGSMHSATEVINWSARRYYRLDISDGYQVVHSLESNASVIDPVVLSASNASLTIDITWTALNSAKLAEYTVYLSDDSAATTASTATWSSLSNSRIISGNSSELYSLVPILSQYYVAITATNTESETTPLSKVYLANNIVTGDPDPSTWHEIIADTDDSPAHWEGRSTHASLVFQNKMWLIGGRTASEAHIAEVWSSTDGYNWTEVNPSAAFGARKEFVSMVHDGKMWVLGGEIEGYVLANDVWYSSDGANWHEATEAASWHARDYFGGVSFASGATGSDEMWVLGHYTGDPRGIPGVEDHHYSTDGSTWSSVSVSGLPPSSFFPAITFNNAILIVGGYFYTNSAWSNSNTIYSSTDGVNWTELSVSGSIWDARRVHTTLVYDDKLWVLAGDSGYNRDDYWYSSDGTQWHEATASGSKWEARSVHTSVNYAGRMWMLGGYGSTGDKQLNDVWASGLEITSFSFNLATTN